MEGNAAPGFSLVDQNNITRTLSDYLGRWVVLYFYPKDGTPLCTTEACSFRDQHIAVGQIGDAEVIGISMDSVDSHREFAEANSLNFPLLSDPDHAIIEAYGCWQDEDTVDRVYLGVKRNTFLVGPDGVIAKVYEDITPEGHVAEIIDKLQELQAIANA